MNNQMNNQFVAELAKNTSETFENALNWVNKSNDPLINKNNKLKKVLHKSIYKADKLAASAHLKMCVGIYGASQTGKSYLVSMLASKGTNRLYAIMGEQEVDYIETINPENNKASTGLVTRFTTDVLTTPESYPIQAKLLSEFDLVKILANSYVNDISHTEDQLETHVNIINNVLNDVETYPTSTSGIKLHDIYELEDFCNANFSHNPRFIALKIADFWSRAADLLPNINNQGRKKLMVLLWQGLPNYSQIYDSLLNVLIQLEHSSTIYCAPEALFNVKEQHWTRSATSILNVSTLDSLVNTDASSVRVVNNKGKQALVSKSNLTALISELVIQIKDQPHDFFATTDLLDFPGARSRAVHPKDAKLLNSQAIKVDVFLRGKVSYLFDRYSNDLEMTALLLCAGPSTINVVGLEKQIADWVDLTQGAKPEEREAKQTSLFLILTNFDKELSQGTDKTAYGYRWTTRLEASLLKAFGAQNHKNNWVHSWHTNRPFNNTYWLRNIKTKQASLIESEGEPGRSKELDINPAKIDFINMLRETFLANTFVNKHFSNPVKAWDSGMSLNDGGITRLITDLEKVCQPEFKRQQVRLCLDSLIKHREPYLRKYYINSDIDSVRKNKLFFATQILKIGGMLLQKKRLGDFISLLLVKDADVYDIFIKSEKTVERLKSNQLNNNSEVADQAMDPELAALLGLTDTFLDSAHIDLTKNASNVVIEDLPNLFVQDFLSYWFNSLQDKLNTLSHAEYLNINHEMLTRLLSNFEIAAHRTGLIKDIITHLQHNSSNQNGSRVTRTWKQVAPITELFNNFIAHGGNYEKSAESFEIIRFDGNTQKIFVPLPEIEDTPNLPETSKDFSLQYFSDWLNGLQHTIRINANYMSGISADVEANNLLEEILTNLNRISTTVSH
jgi:hypothetical protein